MTLSQKKLVVFIKRYVCVRLCVGVYVFVCASIWYRVSLTGGFLEGREFGRGSITPLLPPLLCKFYVGLLSSLCEEHRDRLQLVWLPKMGHAGFLTSASAQKLVLQAIVSNPTAKYEATAPVQRAKATSVSSDISSRVRSLSKG